MLCFRYSWLAVGKGLLPCHMVCRPGTIPLTVLRHVTVQVSTVTATVFINKTVTKCKYQKVEKEVLSNSRCVC